MKIGEGVEWAVHCCTVLALVPSGLSLSAGRLAQYHAVPPAYLAKHLQSLSRAGIVESVAGPRGGYRLAKPATDISVLDVVFAIEGPAPAFSCTEIRQQGPAGVGPEGYPRPCGIARAMWAAEDAWRSELAKRSIADLVVGVGVDATPEAVDKAIIWFQEAMR